MVSALCHAKETLRCQGVGTVTRGREAAFWWSVSLPRAQSPHGTPCSWVTKFRVPRWPGVCCCGSHGDIRDWR